MKQLYRYILEKLNINEVEVGGEFTNLESYNLNMAKGLEDKLFFVKKLPIKSGESWIFVDFGCADGVLINALSIILPKYGIKCKLVGYDISENMINIAKKKFKNQSTDDIEILFTANWDEVLEILEEDTDSKKAIVCNSVIHEVYSYANSQADIDWFWDQITDSGFDYVCVRDMMVNKSIERETDPDMLETFYEHVEEDKPELKRYIKDYEKHWGSLEENKNFIHYLLKYRWTTNWTREVNENYFSVMTEEFLDKMKGFKKVYFEEFRVPFLENCWKEDFGVELEDTTHIKAIFSK